MIIGTETLDFGTQCDEASALMRKYVRITGMRLERYIEFEFSINDGDLAVDLILPISAFGEFCQRQNATILPPEPALAETIERQAWRQRQPGLLRRINDAQG